MRKLLLCAVALGIIFVACHDEDHSLPQETVEIDMSDFFIPTTEDLAARGIEGDERCFTMQVLGQKLKENPGIYQRMYEEERRTRAFIAGKGKPTGSPGGGGSGGGGGGGGSGSDGGTITDYNNFGVGYIPVVFHVIYNSESENLSDDVLEDQIDILNEDFHKGENSQFIPLEFAGTEADINVQFVNAGVIRVKSKKKSWRPNDAMKFTSEGGSDVVAPQHYLNVWIVNNMPYMGGNILGYAQFPNGGDWATDGIVLDHRFVGYNATYGSTGRTATHEVGHWMNLRHIWGDGGCSADDYVADTPLSDRYNTGCPTHPVVHCGSNDMFMNFMDYTNDNCMKLFTKGQSNRMAAVFADGGYRELMKVSPTFYN